MGLTSRWNSHESNQRPILRSRKLAHDPVNSHCLDCGLVDGLCFDLGLGSDSRYTASGSHWLCACFVYQSD